MKSPHSRGWNKTWGFPHNPLKVQCCKDEADSLSLTAPDVSSRFFFSTRPRVRVGASAPSLNPQNPFPCKQGFAGTELVRKQRTFLEPTCQERLSNSSIQPAVSCRCLFFSRFLFIFIWEYHRGKGGRGVGVFGAAGAKLQKQVGRVVCVLNGKIPLADAHRSVQGCGSKGKGGIGVRFLFLDVLLAILVKFTLFLLVVI